MAFIAHYMKDHRKFFDSDEISGQFNIFIKLINNNTTLIEYLVFGNCSCCGKLFGIRLCHVKDALELYEACFDEITETFNRKLDACKKYKQDDCQKALIGCKLKHFEIEDRQDKIMKFIINYLFFLYNLRKIKYLIIGYENSQILLKQILKEFLLITHHKSSWLAFYGLSDKRTAYSNYFYFFQGKPITFRLLKVIKKIKEIKHKSLRKILFFFYKYLKKPFGSFLAKITGFRLFKWIYLCKDCNFISRITEID